MKKYLLLFILFSLKLFSQNITGKVTSASGTPLSGASVYLDGTTIGTSTNQEGEFSISSSTKFNTSLIIRFMGYEDVIISNPYEKTFWNIILQVKENEIEPVFITDDGFTRKQKMQLFKEQFLGINKEGRACKILNEDAIILEFDKKNNRLIAKSYEPISIQNDKLGYKIEFDLYDFYVQMNSRSIKSTDVLQSMFLGTSQFTDIAINQKQIQNREQVYFGSSMELFKTLIHNSWSVKSFVLYEGSFAVNANEFFTILNENGMFKVRVKGSSVIVKNAQDKIFRASFNLLYNKSRQSKIEFNTGEFFVDEFGNTSHRDQIIFGGDLGTQKIGSLLPLNFEPQKK
ncbi:carboxypeptidase-like regulatory domain-containing protein [Flavobacterium sp.]|uniref:carboxypeptidase-like regulatory domain-containing protein n=1 Tax=Flavobacterium sp. TaxID=239 RepID=UPI0035B3BBF9